MYITFHTILFCNNQYHSTQVHFLSTLFINSHYSCKFLAPRFNAYPWISPHHLHRSSSLVHFTQYSPSHLRHRLTSVDISWQIIHCNISVVSTTVGRIVPISSNHFLQATLSFPFELVLCCLCNHARKLPLSWTSAIQRLHAFLSVMLLVEFQIPKWIKHAKTCLLYCSSPRELSRG